MMLFLRLRIPGAPCAVLLVLLLAATPARSAGPAAIPAPYVGAREADTLFADVTPKQMEVLRTKRILFLSRSFGLNLRNGLDRLGKENRSYDLLNSYARYDLFKAGGNLAAVPPDAFTTSRFVHVMATYWPHTVRLRELDSLIRRPPHSFGGKIDVAMVFFHYAGDDVFDAYAATMDSLRRDFPHIVFVYVTAGFMDKNHAAENAKSARFSEQVRQRYRGKVPLYDLGAILSNDGAAGNAYDPSYSTDPAGVHPNAPFAEKRMAKGILVLLSQVFAGGSGSVTAARVGARPSIPAAPSRTVPATAAREDPPSPEGYGEARARPPAGPAAATVRAAPPAPTVQAAGSGGWRWEFEGDLRSSPDGAPAASWQAGPAFDEGVAGAGLRLDGSATGAYVTVSHGPGLDALDAVTLAAWTRLDGPSGGGVVVKKHVVYELALGPDSLRAYLFTGPSVADLVRLQAPVPGLADGAWHHAALVFDGARLAAFVDGREVAQAAWAGRVGSQPTRAVYIGKDPFGAARSFGGWIDDLRILPRAATSNEVASWVAAGRAALSDRVAVRAILDANGLTNRQVSASAVFEDQRVTKLYLQECGLRRIPSEIGRLHHLRLLHAYGDRTLGYPMLAEIAAELGSCTQLEELLLNQNDLVRLPEAIAGLTRLRVLSLGENRLRDLPAAVAAWATRFDPDWRDTQAAGGAR